MIELGKTYKDVITGFEGVATGFVTYLSGCNQALLTPECTEDGTLREAHWFDIQRLKPLPNPQLCLDNSLNPGFDKAAPVR